MVRKNYPEKKLSDVAYDLKKGVSEKRRPRQLPGPDPRDNPILGGSMPRTQIFAAILGGRIPSHAANWDLADFPLLVGVRKENPHSSYHAVLYQIDLEFCSKCCNRLFNVLKLMAKLQIC